MMSQMDLVAVDFEVLVGVVGQMQMTKHDRTALELALSNLRDSLTEMGVEIDEVV